MLGIGDKIKRVMPWLNPFIEYFDWKKSAIASAVAASLAVWSFVKEQPWPTIIVLALAALVHMVYLIVFPQFIRLLNIGVKERPNSAIWKYKKNFELGQAACLLADINPTVFGKMNGEARAWLDGLYEAIMLNEIKYTPSIFDGNHVVHGKIRPYAEMVIDRAEFKKYSEAKGQKPDFLN